MKPIKIRVRSPEHSEVIQKMLFAIGINWTAYGQSVQFNSWEEISRYPYLVVLEDETLIRATERGLSEIEWDEEVDFDWLLPPRETIEIDGFGKFYKDEVEECLDRLERVE